MVDYAHNPHGYIQMKKYLKQVYATKKTGIISATGDRREEDITNIGRYAAQMFDQIIIRHDKDSRGRAKEEISKFLVEGIREVNIHLPISVISDEIDAVQYAIDNAIVDEFIFISVDNIQKTIAYVDQQVDKENTLVDLLSGS